MPRHALIVPFVLYGDQFSFQVPAYGGRLVGPIIWGHQVGGFMVEIPAWDEDDEYRLAWAVIDALHGKPPEAAATLLCRLDCRLLGYDGQPLDTGSEIAQMWESHRQDADAAGVRPNKTRFAFDLVEDSDKHPWLRLSSDPARAAAAIVKRLQRLDREVKQG